MRIVLNFLGLKTGGGAQVGLDFIEQVKRHGKDHEWFLVATQGTPLESVEPTENFRLVATVPVNLVARAWFEHFACRALIRRIRPDIVYTQFGGHWPGATVPHVTGCALPYVAYPEGISLWKGEPFFRRLRLHLHIDYIARQLKRAQKIIFETHVMAERTCRNLNLDSRKISVVLPACSSLVQPGQHHAETALRCQNIPSGFKVVFLSNYYPHKNFFLLPRIAEALRDNYQIQDVIFVLTLPEGHRATSALLRDAKVRGVESMIFNLGPIPQEGCAELYSVADAVILPSRLESFSNTIAEAWAMEKPLLISDLDWARESCGDGALYFDCDNPGDAAAKIYALKEHPQMASKLVEAGKIRRDSYPSSEQRFLEYLRIIQDHAAETLK